MCTVVGLLHHRRRRDDIDALVNPAASEICDDVDNDCDGLTDDDDSSVDLSTVTTWYPDSDGDGYGTTTGSTTACNLSASGYAIDDGDCDDNDPSLYPGAMEICDRIDNDCDGLVDDDDTDVDASSGATRWEDNDVDGYGDPATEKTWCSIQGQGVNDNSDCDDDDFDIKPRPPRSATPSTTTAMARR